jgi:putative addiction module CopG family antidote
LKKLGQINPNFLSFQSYAIGMPTTSVEIPEGLKKRVEEKVESGEYTSNSDFIRYAIRRILDDEQVLGPKAIAELNERMSYSEDDLTDLEEV